MVFATSSADVTYRWIPNIQPRVYFKPSQTATYLVIATNQGACSDSARVKIEVTFPPTVTATVNEAEKCLGGYVVFRASGANTFTWSDKITSGNNFYPTASKYYHVTGTDANGCRDNDSVYVKVFNDTTVTANILSSDTSVCLGRPVKVWASGATSANEKYEWSNGVQDNVDFLLTQPGRYTYVVTGTSPTGCRGVDSVSLRVKPIPPPPSVSSDTICHYNALPLLVAKGKAIKWYDGSSRLLVYAGDTLLPRKHDPGTYTWRLTQEVEGCVSHDSVTSTLYIVPNYKGLKIVTADTTLCEFPKHKSTYAASGTQGNLKWNVTSKAWTHDSRDSSIIGVQWTAQGVDTITLSTTDKYGCSYYTSQVVSIAPYPTASFEAYPNPTMSRARFINLSDSSVIKEVNRRLSMRYEWNFGRDDDKMKGVISRDTLVKYPYGYYDVTLVTTNEFGCSDTISQNIFIDILTNLYVPTAFSPTDRCPEVAMFLPKGFNLKTYNVKVFDTWGNLLWYSDKLIDGQPLEGWDGTYDGVMMKSDVYVWKIEAQFNDNTEWHGQLIDNGTVRRFGSVMLIR
jgi:hypothetical protein